MNRRRECVERGPYSSAYSDVAQTSGIQLVQVTPDDRVRQVWLAAAPRDEALTLVLDAVPEGWSAALLGTRLKPNDVALLHLNPGDVRKLS